MITELSDRTIILKRLTSSDATAFYHLYYPEPGYEQRQATAQSATEFTASLISRCQAIFTIRTVEDPDRLIGDCALHHPDPDKHQIEIGGSLLPEYWGRGIMARAFQLLIVLAKDEYDVGRIVARTESSNSKALRFAEKLGFRVRESSEAIVVLEKQLE